LRLCLHGFQAKLYISPDSKPSRHGSLCLTNRTATAQASIWVAASQYAAVTGWSSTHQVRGWGKSAVSQRRQAQVSVEFGTCEESLLKAQRSIAGHFHEQSDVICIVEKDTGKGIDPIAVCGGDSITRELGYIRRMHACDGGSIKRKVGDPVSDYPVDRAPAQVPDRGDDRRPR